MSGRRFCGCGCGASIEHLRPQARYLNHTHRQRAHDRQKASETGDPTQTPGNDPVTVSGAQDPPQMTPEQMVARLDALAREFDARGSTQAMRKEGRRLAKALGQERPRWLPRDEW
jgi:hypothetical protein